MATSTWPFYGATWLQNSIPSCALAHYGDEVCHGGSTMWCHELGTGSWSQEVWGWRLAEGQTNLQGLTIGVFSGVFLKGVMGSVCSEGSRATIKAWWVCIISSEPGLCRGLTLQFFPPKPPRKATVIFFDSLHLKSTFNPSGTCCVLWLPSTSMRYKFGFNQPQQAKSRLSLDLRKELAPVSQGS